MQGIGAPPRSFDLAVSLARLNRVVAYEPRDLTISVEAGMTVASLTRRLARHRQFVPLDAPLPERSTVGGVLAAGWYGPRRTAFGRPRDAVVGATAVLADGTVCSSGGRVVKNVSGYDVAKLFVGSLGTLGALARVNFKTFPLPQQQRIAVCRLPKRTRERALAHLAALPLEPTAALHVWGFSDEIDGIDGIDGRLIVMFEGSPAALDRATRDVRSSLGAAGVPETSLSDRNAAAILQRAIDAMVTPLGERSVTYRIFGLPETLVDRLAFLHRMAESYGLRAETIADALGGDVVARVSSAREETLVTSIVPFDDALHDALESVSLLASPRTVRANLQAWGTPSAGAALMRSIKAAFDPSGILAPGRLAGDV